MHDGLWDRLLTALASRLPSQVLDTWIRPGRVLDYRDNRLEIGVPNKFIRGYVVEHYLADLRAAAVDCLGPRVQVGRGRDPSSARTQGGTDPRRTPVR